MKRLRKRRNIERFDFLWSNQRAKVKSLRDRKFEFSLSENDDAICVIFFLMIYFIEYSSQKTGLRLEIVRLECKILKYRTVVKNR